MRFALAFLCAVCLGGCAAHTPVLYGGTVTRITVEGTRFVVSHTETRAEATRVSPERLPNRERMLYLALQAIEGASGCTVLPGTLYGDWSLTEAYLDCPETPSPRIQPQQTYRPALTPAAS